MVVNSAHAQGAINMDSYDGTGGTITYTAGVPGNGVNTGPNAAGVANGVQNINGVSWTIGLYYALGSVTVGSDPTGYADPSTLGGGLIYDTTTSGTSAGDGGPGANTTFDVSSPGQFNTGTGNAKIEGYSSGLVTAEVVAFSGSTYDSSAYRGHSAAFTITPATGSATAPYVSSSSGGMPSFSVYSTPEPSILALSGIGAAALMLFRRKK